MKWDKNQKPMFVNIRFKTWNHRKTRIWNACRPWHTDWKLSTFRGLLTPSKAFCQFCVVYLSCGRNHLRIRQLLDGGDMVDTGRRRIVPKWVEVVFVVVLVVVLVDLVLVVLVLVERWRRSFGLRVVCYRYSPPSLMLKMRNEGG